MHDSFVSYVKKSFKLIFEKPILFIPPLFSFLINGLVIMFAMYLVNKGHISFASRGIMLLVIIVVALLELFIASGSYNMFKEVVKVGQTSMDDFWLGIKKYAGRIFLGSLLIGVVVFMAVFILTFFIAKIIPLNFIIAGVLAISGIILWIFISLWTTVLVYENCNLSKAFKTSFSFVKRHFGLILIINLLRGLLTEIKGPNRNGGRNSLSSNNQMGKSLILESYLPINESLGAMSFITLVILAITTFFTLYFNLMLFIVYHDRREGIFTDGLPEN